ncbi:hypothetical protein ACH6EH_07105 [Paenibacillus sp. JSM ZJ436]|uniref:hypothetical protein n=1 Tax=Paenibacillus sp. JSM ZJ436 TaxID=3376190 RepID=UPI003798A289
MLKVWMQMNSIIFFILMFFELLMMINSELSFPINPWWLMCVPSIAAAIAIVLNKYGKRHWFEER